LFKENELLRSQLEALRQEVQQVGERRGGGERGRGERREGGERTEER
jgi:hypothetical protein